MYLTIILLYVVFLKLNVIDYKYTKIILENNGVEFNPFIRAAHKKLGSKGIIAVKGLILFWIGLQAIIGNLDLYTIVYLNICYGVVLWMMKADIEKNILGKLSK